MKRISLLLLLLALLSCISCKKKSASTPTTPSTTSTSSSYPYSVMQTDYTYLDNGSTVTMDSNAIAVFMQGPMGTINNVYISAGNVSLNDSNLYFMLDNYMKVNPINISQTLKWVATGSGTITPFTYTFVPSYPKYVGGSVLPDTCTKMSGITINISGVSNLSGGIGVSVTQGATSIGKSISTNGTVSFSTSEIGAFNTNANFSIELIFQNTTSATLGGVLHSFNNCVLYNKIAYLK